MSSPGPADLRVEGVSFAYGDRPVLEDVSLRVPAGDYLGLIGPNGAGKTTLVRLLCGLLRPAAGRVLLGGRDLRRLPRRAAARTVAFVPQETTAVFPFRTREAVLLGRYPHRGSFAFESPADLEAARAAMESTETAAFADRFLHELSGGERQRVLLARALAQDPAVLLLDEPTSHLDLRHQTRFLDLLDDSRRKAARTVVFVSHDVNLVAHRVRRLVLLKEGCVAADGRPAEILEAGRLEAAYRVRVRLVKDEVTGIPFVFPDRRRGEP